MECSVEIKHRSIKFNKMKEEDCPTLLDILEQRLPISSNVYNAVKTYRSLEPKAYVYTLDLNGEISKESIVLVNIYREEVVQEIVISVPSDWFDKTILRNALIETNAINWDIAYKFAYVERSVGSIVLEISTHYKGNSTLCNPAFAYVVDEYNEFLEQKMDTDHGSCNNNELKQIDLNEGLQFILRSWKFCEEGTEKYLNRVLRLLPSTGLYIDGRIASGALQNANGIIGFLFTRPEERIKGYGVKVMRYLIRQLREKGFAPCSAAEIRNLKSQKLHEKVGMKLSHEVDYIWNKTEKQ